MADETKKEPTEAQKAARELAERLEVESSELYATRHPDSTIRLCKAVDAWVLAGLPKHGVVAAKAALQRGDLDKETRRHLEEYVASGGAVVAAGEPKKKGGNRPPDPPPPPPGRPVA